MNALEKMVSISSSWDELESNMGEMAALEVACQQHGVDSEWYYDNLDLIG